MHHQSTTERPAKTVAVHNGSMYVMEPGCQQYFRHRVPSVNAVTNIGDRFSLSFRHILAPCSEMTVTPSAPQLSPVLTRPLSPTAPQLSPVLTRPLAPSASSPGQSSFSSLPAQPTFTMLPPNSITHKALISPQKQFHSKPLSRAKVGTSTRNCSQHFDQGHKKVVLLLGTSMTKWVKPETLSDGFCEFINISHSGAHIANRRSGHHIPDFGDMMDNFTQSNPEKAARVRQIIFSLGTNDIKFYRKDNGRGNMATPGDLSKFHRPLTNLVKSARYNFGNDVNIYFQSVLPMRVLYSYTTKNFEGFNVLLRQICNEMNCKFLDWFKLFLNDVGNDYNSNLFADSIHLNRKGYDVLHRCLKFAVDADRYAIMTN